MNGYTGKILHVDLSTSAITVEEPPESFYRRYMGGSGFVGYYLLKEIPKGADPLGPENVLIFAAGPVTGVAIGGAGRNAVGAKSPLNGGYGEADVGGYFGAEMRRAGYDAVVIHGAAPTPVYLWIKDGEAEIRPADHLWGTQTLDFQNKVCEELGEPRARTAAIGPGGEKLVRYACVMNDVSHAAGRTGLGAVMGSKKLKAVVSLGTEALEGADHDTIREMARRAAQEVREGTRSKGLAEAGTGGKALEGGIVSGNMPIRNFRDGEFPEISGLEYIMDKIGIGMEGCWACPVRCKKVVQAHEPFEVDSAYGGAEYESIGALGSTCGVGDVVAMSKANELCNAHSLDTIGAGLAVAFGMECFEEELISVEDTGGIELRFGNGEAMVAMVEKIAKREGIGDVLADGLLPAAAKIGQGAERFAVHAKGQAQPMHEPRLKRGLAIGYAMSPTGADHCHSLHDTSLVYPNEDGFMQNGRLRGMGVLEAMELESLGPEKVRATIYNTMASIMLNCLTMCSMPGWSIRDLAEMVDAATGWDVSEYEILKLGERAMNLARVFNMREGLTTEDDVLCERSYTPTRGGALAEGGIDREELRQAVHTYYGMMGWDPERGLPTRAKLYELELDWVVDELGGAVVA